MKNTPCIPVVGVVTAMWKRHELTDIVFANLKNIRESLANIIDLRLVVAGSEGDASRTLAERHGFSYIDVPNSPLGAKWNAALRLLHGQDIEGVCIVGSDDLLNEAYFRMVAQSVLDDEKLFGIDSFYVFDRFSGRMFHWMGYPPPRDKKVIGLGRFIHKDYIEALNWALWEDDKECGLDASMCRRIDALGSLEGIENSFAFKSVVEHGIVAVDIKHEQQMWPYEITALFSHSICIIGDARIFLEQYYDDKLLDRIFEPIKRQLAISNSNYYIPPWCVARQLKQKKYINASLLLSKNIIHGDLTSIFVPFSHRCNISYIPSVKSSDQDFIDIISTFCVMKKPQPDIKLHVCTFKIAQNYFLKHNIMTHYVGNIHAWRNLFKVYIIDECKCNILIIKDLLNHGNIVVSISRSKYNVHNIKHHNMTTVDTIPEALIMAHKIHNDKNNVEHIF